MFNVPEKVQESLRCSLCNGYLSNSPVVVNNKNQQICAKCYKILPQSEKNHCLRQISYETIASTLIFPCRYYKMGCDYTLTWNTNDSHESECPKRYFTYPDVVGINNDNKRTTVDANTHNYPDVDEKIAKNIPNYYSHSNKASHNLKDQIGKNNPAYGSSTTILTNLSDDVLSKPLISSEAISKKSAPIYENFYETLPTSKKRTYDHCSNCQKLIKEDTSHCLFGHVTCGKCKGEMCLICFRNHDGTSKQCCKNVARGCKVKLLEVDAAYHRDNCEFNVLQCPVEICDNKDILDDLKLHIKEHHSDAVYEKDDLSIVLNKQDKVFVFLIYDSIFSCAYYYYATYIEIFVTYLGPCEKARRYVFEVSVLTNSKLNKKRREVANWNNSMLASGVNFDKKELIKSGDKKFSFEMNVKIFHTENTT